LEDQPPGPERAMAYSDLALRIGMYSGRREEAEPTAARAIAVLDKLGMDNRHQAVRVAGESGPVGHVPDVGAALR
jgi:hypothetical protein